MSVLKNLLAYIILFAEAFVLSHFICAEGNETAIFLTLSALFSIIAVYAIHMMDEFPLFIASLIAMMFIVPLASVIITIPIEIIMSIVGIFGVKGTVGLAIIVSLIFGILSNCVFIFFF